MVSKRQHAARSVYSAILSTIKVEGASIALISFSSAQLGREIKLTQVVGFYRESAAAAYGGCFTNVRGASGAAVSATEFVLPIAM